MRLEAERASLSNEVVELSASLRQAEAQLTESAELRTSYDALLQMYGEKLEEYQELKMDLDDVKHMYKQQVILKFQRISVYKRRFNAVMNFECFNGCHTVLKKKNVM